MTITKRMQADAIKDIERAKQDLDARAARWSNADIEVNTSIDDVTSARKHLAAAAADSALKAALPAAIHAAEARLDAAKEEEGESKKIPCEPKDDAGEKIDKVLAALDAIGKRFDGINSRMDALEKGKEEDGAEAARVDRKKKDAEGPFGGGKEGSGNSEKGEPREMTADRRKDAYFDSYDSDEARNMLSDIRSKDEQIYSAFGDSAPRPMQNETPFEYERRSASKLKTHSPDWRDINLRELGSDALKIAASQIRKDAWAVATSNNHPGIEGGGLREIRKVNRDTGHIEKTFYGSFHDWAAPFMPPRRLARFNLGRIRNYESNK